MIARLGSDKTLLVGSSCMQLFWIQIIFLNDVCVISYFIYIFLIFLKACLSTKFKKLRFSNLLNVIPNKAIKNLKVLKIEQFVGKKKLTYNSNWAIVFSNSLRTN